jgi:hydroxymethylbilane synthase
VTTLRIGTRGSALALWQSGYIASRLREIVPDIVVELVEISSEGDRVMDVPLSHVEGTGFFTAAIERGLLSREVDVAVHSHKDLPVESTPGLVVAAVPLRAPVEDVLCGRNGMTLAQLPVRAKVGTCSARRTAQILELRPDVEIVPLRGNVPTRVERVGADLDAVVLAKAGLSRLGLTSAISETFPLDRVLPAPAQGALAVQCRAEDDRVRELLARLDHPPTRRAVVAERALLHALEGGCSVPVGAAAWIEAAQIHLLAGVFDLRGERTVRVADRGDEPVALGERAAQLLLAGGAAAILAEFGRTAAASAMVEGQ